MAIKFQDYYETLGVPKTAPQGDIQKAYRKLARKFHPDVNKDKGAEDKFKRINEAYEVLKDPEKRSRYDALGSGFHAGQEFRPPPGFDGGGFNFHTSGGQTQFGSMGGSFSDFFEALFGGASPFGAEQHGARAMRGHDQEAEIMLSLEDVMQGGTKQVTFEQIEYDAHGVPKRELKTLKIKIPKGIRDGTTIRLSGQGGSGNARGEAGDLLLRVKIAQHPRYKIEGDNLVMSLPVAPWEATLGAPVSVKTLDGEIRVQVPSGAQNGQRLRIRGKGLFSSGEKRGDLMLEIAIAVPGKLSAKERELMEQLKAVSAFNPRA